MPDDIGRPLAAAEESAALAELIACDTLTSVSAWLARWSARGSGASAAIVWTPDPLHPQFLASASSGGAAREGARRTVGREEPVVRDLLRDRQPRLLATSESAYDLRPPRGAASDWTVLLPIAGPGTGAATFAVVALYFEKKPRLDDVLERLGRIRALAVPAVEAASRHERRSAGMLHAIERLTNLYDISKAFGSTIDGDELTALITRKAAELMTAEAATLWLLEGDENVVPAATAINESYEVPSPPEHVGAHVVGDVLAERQVLRDNAIEGSPATSLLAVPLLEEDRPIGALIVANKRGRVHEFSDDDAELLEDLGKQAVRALRIARQHEAERRVEELDALLAVSREITATLDLDKVMRAIVNATSALIAPIGVSPTHCHLDPPKPPSKFDHQGALCEQARRLRPGCRGRT